MLVTRSLVSQSYIDQHTYTLGGRWDLKKNLALKAQVDWIRGTPASVSLFKDTLPGWMETPPFSAWRWILCSSHASAVVIPVAGATGRRNCGQCRTGGGGPNAASTTQQLRHEEVINIFLWALPQLAQRAGAVPIDQPESSALRAEFYRRLVNKELNQINAYWSLLIFSGRTSPPLQASSASEVIQLLAANPGGVAYVERSQVDKRFRIVLEFPR